MDGKTWYHRVPWWHWKILIDGLQWMLNSPPTWYCPGCRHWSLGALYKQHHILSWRRQHDTNPSGAYNQWLSCSYLQVSRSCWFFFASPIYLRFQWFGSGVGQSVRSIMHDPCDKSFAGCNIYKLRDRKHLVHIQRFWILTNTWIVSLKWRKV